MRFLIMLALFGWSSGINAQVSDLLESNKKGLEILRRSLKAYGGSSATDSLKLAFTMNAEKNTVRGQSLRPNGPYESYVSYFDFMIDRPAGLELEKRKSTIAGFVFESTSFYKNGKGFSYDPQMKQYSEITGNSIVPSMTYLPQNSIAAALRSPLSVRFIKEDRIEDDDVYLVTYAIGSNLDNLYINKKTNYVVKQQRIYGSVAGEELYEFHFRNQRQVGKIVVPAETEIVVHNSVYGKTSNSYTFSNMRTEFSIDTTLLKIPEGYVKQDYSYRKKFEARELAKDVYLLENITSSTSQWSYNVLFVVMDEWVLVAEAPLNAASSNRVIAKIAEIAPGKPIRYLVQSHHHDDHLGGIRSYIAEGTTIVTTKDNVELIKKIAEATSYSNPDRLAQNPKAPKFELISNKKLVIKDQHHEVVIYDIGPNPHAHEMLIVYLPNERILYEADHINKGEYPINEVGKAFMQKVKDLGLQVDKIASLHGQVLEKQDVGKILAGGNW